MSENEVSDAHACHLRAAFDEDAECENDSFCEPLETRMCHICNIEVPNMFLKEHETSEKHQLNQKICKQYLKRATRQINLDIINDQDRPNNVYFCKTCCKVIKTENRSKHESSIDHAISIDNDGKLRHFYEKYITNDQAAVSASDSDREDASMRRTDESNTNSSSAKKSRLLAKDKTFCDICNIDVPRLNFESHLQSTEHNKKRTDILYDNKIQLKYNNAYWCSYCKLSLTEDKLFDHVKLNSHVVLKSVCDGNETGLALMKYNFNGQCAELENNIVAVVNDLKSQNGQAVSNTHKILTTVNKLSSDLQQQKAVAIEQQKSIALLQQNIAVKQQPTTSTSNKESCKSNVVAVPNKLNIYNRLLCFTNGSKTQVNCLICNCNISYVESNVIQHVEDEPHQQNQGKLLKFHSIISHNAGYHCKCCGVPVTDFFEHLNSMSHVYTFQLKYNDIIDGNLLRKFVYGDNEDSDDDEENDDSNEEYADSDGEYDDNDEEYNEDTEPWVDIMYRQLYDNLLKCNRVVKKQKGYYCEVCQIRLNRKSEISHMLGKKHRANITKK